MQPALTDARESLAYWESRCRDLPVWAVRRRREARELARRWQARVAEAEREVYGRGLLGAVLLLVEERRLPLPTQRRVGSLVRRTLQAVAATVLLTALVALWAAAAIVEALL